MNLLFVCRHNRFRSKFAKAYFDKINKDKSIKTKSAGLFRGKPLDKNFFQIAKKYGLKLGKKPQGVSTKLLEWQDLIVIVADDVPESAFHHKKFDNKVKSLKIKDDYSGKKAPEERKVLEIMKRIDKFYKELSK